MKKKIGLTLSALALSAVMCLGVACGGNPPPAEETYTITFKDGDRVIKTETKKKNEKVTVPGALTNTDPRYTFTGWEGVNSGATEVTVLADKTYNALWNEMFGSNDTFTIKQRNLTKNITVDGAADAKDDGAWDDTTALKLDENGSTLKLLWDNSALYLYADIVKEAEAPDGEDEDETSTQAEDEGETTPGEGEEGEGEEEKAKDYLIVTLDLLHSDKLAADNWDGINWGGVYRGEGELMVEGGYTISLGEDENGEPVTNVVRSIEYLSNSGYTGSEAEFVTTEKGYAVEFKIDLTDSRIGEYKPALYQQIGLAVRTADGASAIETFKGYGDHGPKSLSNMQLVPNESNAETTWFATEVREHYDVTVDGEEDSYKYGQNGAKYSLYSDTNENVEGEESDPDNPYYGVKALWKEGGKLYLFADFKDGNIEKIEITAFGGSVTLTPDDPEGEIAAEGIESGAHSYLTIKVDDETVVDGEKGEGLITLDANANNYGRKMMEAKRLAEDATIEVDGDLDGAYGDKVTDIDTFSLAENGSRPQATGELYIRWDDEALYVFVDVTDSDVSTSQIGDAHNNDSVEVWLDTCQSFQAGQGWGGGNDNNRPLGDYRGEGCFRVLAGKVGDDTGMHWLWDDPTFRATTASKLTDKGYTVEYKIPWAHKLGAWDDGFGNYIPSTGVNTWDFDNGVLGEPSAKLGEIINLTVNINDDNGKDGARDGINSTNAKGCEAWTNPKYLDHLKLVAAD